MRIASQEVGEGEQPRRDEITQTRWKWVCMHMHQRENNKGQTGKRAGEHPVGNSTAGQMESQKKKQGTKGMYFLLTRGNNDDG